MRLLIVTQVIDTEHPVLGFFHRWVEEFAKHGEQVHIICLQKGKYNLPENVTVHSLGKEEGRGRWTYLFRFYKCIWQLRHEYDNVFVHMNQIYVVLGAPFWRATRKRIGLWYMHGSTPITLKIASYFTHHIFTGSPESCKLASKKIQVTGHGIDTDRFFPQPTAKDLDLITVGRITEAKNITALIKVLAEVRASHDVSLTIVGAAVTKVEQVHEAKLRALVSDLQLSSAVHFMGRVSQSDLPRVLNRAKVFVTAAQNGSLDKAILEAMACGIPVVSMAPGSASLPLNESQVSDVAQLTLQIKNVLKSGVFIDEEKAAYIKENHSIASLVPEILQSY